MPYATRKRDHDYESLSQLPIKRRRGNPFEQVSGRPLPVAHAGVSSNSKNLTTGGIGSDILESFDEASSSLINTATTSTVFSDANISKISKKEMESNIRDEMKRLQKHKQEPDSSDSGIGSDSRNPQKTLFTFPKMQLICERMLKEREEEVRKQYDAILKTKLAEQYDSFVRYTYDELQRHSEAAPSYLS